MGPRRSRDDDSLSLSPDPDEAKKKKKPRSKSPRRGRDSEDERKSPSPPRKSKKNKKKSRDDRNRSKDDISTRERSGGSPTKNEKINDSRTNANMTILKTSDLSLCTTTKWLLKKTLIIIFVRNPGFCKPRFLLDIVMKRTFVVQGNKNSLFDV